ncbi:MAG: hypothetical protein LBQ15_10235 [Clostridium sp.]|nr:hypothetical protein [Clostridium sp.]
MKKDLNTYLTVGFLCAVWLAFTVADFLTPDHFFSENENRVLAAKPKWDQEEVLSGAYMEAYESYVTDQFVSRDRWIQIKTVGDIVLQKKSVNGVYLAKRGYLIEQHLAQDLSQERVEGRLALLKKLTERYDANVMLVPTADNILTDKLPANAPYYQEGQLLEQVREAVGEERVIDTFSILREHREEEIYYRTDHHWTTLGAYYGYLAWAEKVGKVSYPYRIAGLETVSDTFLGTLHSKINLPMKGEKIQIFPETKKRAVTLTYDMQTAADSWYEEKYLSGKNQYGYFLDDNHALIEIDTGYIKPASLFVVKDSYANCFVPLLAPHYENIYMVDLRYYHGDLFALIDQYQTERGIEVLVLYDCIHFLEDFQY